MALIDTTFADLRFAFRSLKKHPGFTFFAIITIALCLGANAAIFSLVDGVLLKSIGYPEPERIVQIWEKPPRGTRNGIAAANYIDWTKQSQSFEAMAAQTGGVLSYSGGGEPKSLRASFVSAPYFDVFGVKASIGRTFARDEDQAGKDKVVVLTYRVWNSVFGADRGIVGRDVQLNGEPYRVIGVLPGAGEFDRRGADVYTPLVFPANPARDYHYMSSVARLKRGVSYEQSQAEMSAIAARIAEQYPAVKKNWGATVDRYLDRVVGPQLRLSLIVLMCAVGAVLLIGCTNLANLLMARATLRSREISVRIALGAARSSIVRLLLTESLMLSVVGGVLGVALGYGLLLWIQSLLPPFYFPAEANVGMDGRVLLFLSVATLMTSVFFGLAPAWEASKADAVEALKEGGRSNSAGKGKLYARNIFVGVQVAMAFILLAGAGLLIRSFQKVMDVELNFESEGLVAGYLPLANEKSPDAVQLIQYTSQLIDSIRAVPGVRDAAVATALPLRGWGDGMPFRMAGSAVSTDQRSGTGFKIVTPGYFQTLGLRLIAGRVLNERDTAGSPLVTVVNESFVKRYSPNENAIGKRILVEKILPTRRGLGPEVAWEIVGVVADEKGYGVESTSDEGAYAAFAQNPAVGIGIVAKGGGDSGALMKSVQQAIWSVNKSQVVDRMTTVENLKSESLSGRRMSTWLLGGFAVLAMLLACAGIYGVLSFVTARRTQELGIRAAMGASRIDLVRLVIGGGAIPVVVGIVAGLAGAAALSKYMQSLLFRTSPLDAVSLAAVTGVFLAVALVACLVPALRASSVDPMSALRQE
jgi:putative ABC transport system permease protein